MSDVSAMPGVSPPGASIRAALERAVAERQPLRFAIVETVGEGRFYPNGMEERSGDVLTEDGRVWLFWTGWDSERGRVVIREWVEEDDPGALVRTPAFARARRALGLDVDGAA
jgi:hypothetical protein